MIKSNKATIDYKEIEGNLNDRIEITSSIEKSKTEGIINDNIKVEGVISNKIEIDSKLSPGARGKSSYEIWLDEGNEGSVQDFLNIMGGDKHYIFDKSIASEEWEIKHNLNKHPSVTVVDSADTIVHGEVQYIDNSKLIITFSVGFAGKAYLN